MGLTTYLLETKNAGDDSPAFVRKSLNALVQTGNLELRTTVELVLFVVFGILND